jgi:creatinine amidohydrolase
MKNGIFTDTMADMKWTDIKNLADRKAIVLIPLGVIEEHGPQLCLGTDIYTAHIQCALIRDKLIENGKETVIAPPFFWGVCQSTSGFIGSFRIRKETATALLYDIIASLAGFGFTNIFGISAHGDIEHNLAIMEAFQKADNELQVNARFVFNQSILHHYSLSGNEPYLCPVMPQTVKISSSQYQDVHGGDIETAVIHNYYPDLVDTDKAKALPPVALEEDTIMTWLFGGHTKELSPEGYVGAPADYEGVDVREHLHDVAERTTKEIINHL